MSRVPSVLEGHSPDEHRVYEGEYGVVGGNTERQRDGRDQREPPILEEEANREAKVLEQAHW